MFTVNCMYSNCAVMNRIFLICALDLDSGEGHGMKPLEPVCRYKKLSDTLWSLDNIVPCFVVASETMYHDLRRGAKTASRLPLHAAEGFLNYSITSCRDTTQTVAIDDCPGTGILSLRAVNLKHSAWRLKLKPVACLLPPIWRAHQRSVDWCVSGWMLYRDSW